MNIGSSPANENRVVTSVHGIPIVFDASDLILGTVDSGLKNFTSRGELEFARFSLLDAVRYICRRHDPSDKL